jgi:hypothetical protein
MVPGRPLPDVFSRDLAGATRVRRPRPARPVLHGAAPLWTAIAEKGSDMKHVSSAFRHNTRVACLGTAVLLAGVAGLRAAGDKPAAADPVTAAAATPATTCNKPAATPTCCAGAAEVSIRDAAPATAGASVAPTAGEAGMRAYLDPESGGVLVGMPSPEAGAVQAAQATPELQQEVLPDGSVMMHLQGTGQEYLVLEIDAKGERTVRCVQDPKQALATPSTHAKPEVK